SSCPTGRRARRPSCRPRRRTRRPTWPARCRPSCRTCAHWFDTRLATITRSGPVALVDVRWGRLVAALVAVLVAVVVAVCAMRWGGVAGVRAEVAAAGAWAPLLFVALQALVTITPLPRTMFTVAAGVLFGAGWGLALTITGTALAALAAYGLVRWVGGPLVARHEHRPSLARVRLVPFLLGTVLGVLPGTIAVVVLGDAVTSGEFNPALFAVSFAGAALGLAGATIAARRVGP